MARGAAHRAPLGKARPAPGRRGPGLGHDRVGDLGPAPPPGDALEGALEEPLLPPLLREAEREHVRGRPNDAHRSAVGFDEPPPVGQFGGRDESRRRAVPAVLAQADLGVGAKDLLSVGGEVGTARLALDER